LVTKFLFFKSFHCPQLFTALLSYRCSGVPARRDHSSIACSRHIGSRDSYINLESNKTLRHDVAPRRRSWLLLRESLI